ncbi:response regulator [Adhaeribacter aquaticus]|uniref:response regulator n=1 Tax=Adhaeribacter aquaticus TaxID=299567 RepID=UPI00055601C7|nr:response regulator [Adhaeribacter aquaticus]
MNTDVSIMLVEDDYMDVRNVERELKKINVDIPLYTARNGREALAMLRGEGVPQINPLPSVIMLDINMPRMNGLEFLAELRKDPILKDLNVFIMTTSSEDSDRMAAQNLHVSGYIEKPLTFDKFGGKDGSTIDSFSLFLDLLKLK